MFKPATTGFNSKIYLSKYSVQNSSKFQRAFCCNFQRSDTAEIKAMKLITLVIFKRSISELPSATCINSKIKKIADVNTIIIETILLFVHNRMDAKIINIEDEIPEIITNAIGIEDSPCEFVADAITDNMYVSIPKIASVLLFMIHILSIQ